MPLLKQGDRRELTYYRPISIISGVAKVFERIIYDQVNTSHIDNDLISNSQSGFRRFHSTVTAFHEATNEWAYKIDSGMVYAVFSQTAGKHLIVCIMEFCCQNCMHMELQEIGLNPIRATVSKNVL